MENIKWYDRKLVVFILTTLFFPIGIYCALKSKTLSNRFKIIIFILPALFYVLMYTSNEYYQNKFNKLHSCTKQMLVIEDKMINSTINKTSLNDITINEFLNDPNLSREDKLTKINIIKIEYVKLFGQLDSIMKETLFHLKLNSKMAKEKSQMYNLQESINKHFSYQIAICLKSQQILSDYPLDINLEADKIQNSIKILCEEKEREIINNQSIIDWVSEKIN
jgi:hypothetical protein